MLLSGGLDGLGLSLEGVVDLAVDVRGLLVLALLELRLGGRRCTGLADLLAGDGVSRSVVPHREDVESAATAWGRDRKEKKKDEKRENKTKHTRG